MRYKPGNKSGSTTADAMKWYESLIFTEKRYVDKMINNYIAYVKDRSNTQASHNGGVELVYKVMKKVGCRDGSIQG